MSGINRKITRTVCAGNVKIGGSAPVSVQSMTTTDTRDVSATVKQIEALQDAGCEIVRVAVVDEAAAIAIRDIKKAIRIPIVADIHFDYRLAIKSIDCGADKIRINPGNIGSRERVKEVVLSAKAAGIPIRVGVNSGSISNEMLEKYGGITPEALVESASSHIAILEDLGFKNTVISIKASNVPLMIDACRLFSQRFDYPMHLGVTEAGTVNSGIIKSSVGIGCLLAEGIGDTIRVSLTGDPVNEVKAAREILKSLGLSSVGPEVVSCPTCGRCGIDLAGIADRVEQALSNVNKNIKVAIMGCAVNGPGEARDADIGIAGGKGEALFFRKGEIIRKVPEDKIVEELIKEINNY
ncbi:MAG: flavodoxin-dependent (E)-4-hydroxy-3-methylbut-2-enyl-diphosphate synthase [Eubacteriales bacterium]|nr:flavodoxin-dependent (E)-4-hydroxy-3-methylbut-2-enyl-diphosphate synthase [Eubacteriales bacterium]